MISLSITNLLKMNYNELKNLLIDNKIPYAEVYFSTAVMRFIYIKNADNYVCRLIIGNTDDCSSVVSVKIFNGEIKDIIQDDVDCFEYYDAGRTNLLIYY